MTPMDVYKKKVLDAVAHIQTRVSHLPQTGILMGTGLGDALPGRLLLLDAQGMEWRSVALSRDPACPVCGQRR